jgi:hypothetical protein
MIAKPTNWYPCRGRGLGTVPCNQIQFVPRPASCRSSAGNPAADPSALALSTVVLVGCTSRKPACMPKVTGDPFRPSQQSV